MTRKTTVDGSLAITASFQIPADLPWDGVQDLNYLDFHDIRSINKFPRC